MLSPKLNPKLELYPKLEPMRRLTLVRNRMDIRMRNIRTWAGSE